MTMDKTKLLDQLEEQIELHIKTAIKDFQNLSEEILLKPAENGGWSIAQCLEHLNSYGRYYLPAIHKGLQKQREFTQVEKFKSSWLGNYFKKIMDPVTGKKKFKAIKGHIPEVNLKAYGVVAEFIQQQETLLKYIADARKKDLNNIKIPISISKLIRLNLSDTFQFIVAHDERHLQQAGRGLKVKG